MVTPAWCFWRQVSWLIPTFPRDSPLPHTKSVWSASCWTWNCMKAGIGSAESHFIHQDCSLSKSKSTFFSAELKPRGYHLEHLQFRINFRAMSAIWSVLFSQTRFVCTIGPIQHWRVCESSHSNFDVDLKAQDSGQCLVVKFWGMRWFNKPPWIFRLCCSCCTWRPTTKRKSYNKSRKTTGEKLNNEQGIKV